MTIMRAIRVFCRLQVNTGGRISHCLIYGDGGAFSQAAMRGMEHANFRVVENYGNREPAQYRVSARWKSLFAFIFMSTRFYCVVGCWRIELWPGMALVSPLAGCVGDGFFQHYATFGTLYLGRSRIV